MYVWLGFIAHADIWGSILKPWIFVSTSPVIVVMLGRQCKGTHVTHAPCAGSDTRRSQGYTPALVARLHDAIAEHYRAEEDDELWAFYECRAQKFRRGIFKQHGNEKLQLLISVHRTNRSRGERECCIPNVPCYIGSNSELGDQITEERQKM